MTIIKYIRHLSTKYNKLFASIINMKQKKTSILLNAKEFSSRLTDQCTENIQESNRADCKLEYCK